MSTLSKLLTGVAVVILIFAFYISFSKADTWIVGDSIGVGVAQAGGLHSVAKVGATINQATTQLARVPKGSTIIVFAGTNDAVGNPSEAEADARIRKFLSRAETLASSVIWAGPPCTSKPKKWSGSAARLDKWLAARVPHYVSLQHGSWCSGKDRGGDGIHFTMKGYKILLDYVLSH